MPSVLLSEVGDASWLAGEDDGALAWDATLADQGLLVCPSAVSAAAADAVRREWRRLLFTGGKLVPLIFDETMALDWPADETMAFVRSWATELEGAERSQVIRHAWQQYSTVLQSGNAEMILSAIG